MQSKKSKAKTRNYLNNKHSFILIEILVAITIFLVIITTVSNLFFSLLKGSTKVIVTNEAKQNGEYALSVMERMIRNASSIQDMEVECDGTEKAFLTIKNSDNQLTTFFCPSGTETRIASSSAITYAYLTSNNVTVSNCSFVCNLSLGNPAVVKISFSVSQPQSAGFLRPEETITINYSTSVVVRNTGF